MSKKSKKIKINKLKDPHGSALRFELLLLLLYQTLIQRFFLLSGFIPFICVLILLTIFLDSGKNISRLMSNYSVALYIMISYVVLTIALSFFNSPDEANHFKTGFMILEFSIPMIASCYYIKTRENLDFFINIFMIVFGLMVVIFLFNNEIVIDSDGIARRSINEDTNPNTLALCASFFAWAVLYKVSQKKINIVVGAAFVVMATIAVAMTGSRKGFISLAIILLCWLFFVFLQDNKENQLKKFLGAVAILLAVLFVAIPYLESTELWSRLQSFNDEGTANRIDMYEKGWKYLMKSPLLGIGFEGFRKFYGYYSHSNIVEVFVSSGFIIGAMYYISIVSLFVARVKFMIEKKKNKDWNNCKLYYKMSSILFLTIIVSMFYIIHIYDIQSFYSFSFIMAYAVMNFSNNKIKKDEELPNVDA